MNYRTTTLEHLTSLLVERAGPDALLLLGAGASLKSGVPLSGEIAERAAKWAYCRSHGRSPEDPTVTRSDWLRWLHDQPWYRVEHGPAENYSAVIEHLLQPREDRKAFFLRIIKSGVPASPGYERLADLMAAGAIRTVLTTNFDAVLADLCRGRPRPHHVEVIKTSADYTNLSTFPNYPQIVYLHGSVEHYTDKNLLEEVERLDEELMQALVPLLRDHPLVVIGYRGAEPSIMRHLLIEQAAACNQFRHGIFWCALEESIKTGLHPLVDDLAIAIDGNLQLVSVAGFDEVMAQVWDFYERDAEAMAATRESQSTVDHVAPTLDLQPIREARLDELDWLRVQSQIVAYCRRMAMPIPNSVQRAWLVDRLCDLDLAVRDVDGVVHPTFGGYLLFAHQPATRIGAAEVVLRSGGDPDRVFAGNLWSQLEAIMEALEEVNQPFRLKGATSETVHPYPALAFKEVVVNALVHRTYGGGSVVIEVEPNAIHITNPGGLVEEVQKALHPGGVPMQERIERGARGIKGYRNPVIADLFYGAGAMDKAGSGLADVQNWVRENGGQVRFGPTPDNRTFDVRLFRRLEQADPVTGTAAPLLATTRYVSNLMEVAELPAVVWHGTTAARRPREVWQSTAAPSLPPFILHEGRLFTFADLSDHENLLATQVERGDVETLSLHEFAAGADGERRLVNLLNECLYRLCESRDLVVDKRYKRTYFPRTEAGPREVSYQARLRRATRTVVKPVISKTTQKVRFWEHEAIRFGFERYGNTWVLTILPGYVFTMNGWRRLVEGSRVGKLATRRAAHDYNPHVHNDLVFWTWVLSDGRDSFSVDAGCGAQIQISAALAAADVSETVEAADEAFLELVSARQDALDGLLEEVAEIAEEEGEEGQEEAGGIAG